jgi:hypothetical protein
LSYLAVSALCDLPDIARVAESFTLFVPIAVEDRRRAAGRIQFLGPVAIYTGATHLTPGQTVDAMSADVLGDFSPFKSNPNLSVVHTNPSLYYESTLSQVL